MSYASEWVQQNRLSAGRFIFCVRRIKEIAQAEGLTDITARCDSAEAAGAHQHKQERQWILISTSPQRLEDAGTLDQKLDAAVSAPEALCKIHIEAGKRGVDSPQHKAAQLILKECYPAGARAITHVSYVEQVGALRELLKVSQGAEVSAAITLLGLNHFFDTIAQNIDAYELSVQRQGKPFTFRDVEHSRTQSHEELCELIALILSTTSDTSKLAMRNRLLAPISEQTEAQRERRRRQLAPTDLDPNTGAEEPLSPQVEPGA